MSGLLSITATFLNFLILLGILIVVIMMYQRIPPKLTTHEPFYKDNCVGVQYNGIALAADPQKNECQIGFTPVSPLGGCLLYEPGTVQQMYYQGKTRPAV